MPARQDCYKSRRRQTVRNLPRMRGGLGRMKEELTKIIYQGDYEALTPLAQEIVDNVIKWHFKELEFAESEAYKKGYIASATIQIRNDLNVR